MDYDELFRMSFNQAREEIKEEMKDEISCALIYERKWIVDKTLKTKKELIKSVLFFMLLNQASSGTKQKIR